MPQAHDLALEGRVVAVAADPGHHFSKPTQDRITLVEDNGVEGDAHAGPFVRHRYLARRRPRLPNLRQVHLIRCELFPTFLKAGFEVGAGDPGENITTAPTASLWPAANCQKCSDEVSFSSTFLHSSAWQKQK